MTEAARIADGTVVGIHYTLTLANGEEVDSSIGGEPLLYLHGQGNIVPGLESQLATRVVGDKLMATVPAKDGYGERQPDGLKTVPRTAFPKGTPLEPGMSFGVQNDDGQVVPVWIHKVDKAEVELDFNHPLSGEVLHFQVEVVSIRAATKDEVKHGHPHGPGGHHH